MKRLRALSIKQPFAEQIMRGMKRFEYRSQKTNVRGRVYVYASLGPRPAADWKKMNVGPGDVPLGRIVGTVEIFDCRPVSAGGCEWSLRAPKRLRTPIAPAAHPQPVWFYPFGR